MLQMLHGRAAISVDLHNKYGVHLHKYVLKLCMTSTFPVWNDTSTERLFYVWFKWTEVPQVGA